MQLQVQSCARLHTNPTQVPEVVPGVDSLFSPRPDMLKQIDCYAYQSMCLKICSGHLPCSREQSKSEINKAEPGYSLVQKVSPTKVMALGLKKVVEGAAEDAVGSAAWEESRVRRT